MSLKFMSTLSVRIPKDIEKRLNYLAHETGRTKTYYVREAITEHISEIEDVYIALSRLEKPSKRWSQEELEKNRDLED
jgi:RHH-type transcriptional regulator, rel operon repressor / antitoxin RelB